MGAVMSRILGIRSIVAISALLACCIARAVYGGEGAAPPPEDAKKILDLSYERYADEDDLLRRLAERDDWEGILVPGDRVTDRSLEAFSRLAGLRYIFLVPYHPEGPPKATGVTPAGLAKLAELPNLERLVLFNVPLGPTLEALAAFPELRDLSLENVHAEDPGELEAIVRLPKLEKSISTARRIGCPTTNGASCAWSRKTWRLSDAVPRSVKSG